MNTIIEKKLTFSAYPPPVRMTRTESWMSDVLAEAFATDPAFRFWFGKRLNKRNLEKFFKAILEGMLESGGAIFAMPDQKAVVGWRWYGADFSEERQQQIFNALGAEGTKRYLWLGEATTIPIDPKERDNIMRPQYIGVRQGVRCHGIGSHLLTSTFNYFKVHGFSIPYIVASTRRSAKLYDPLLDYYVSKEVFMADNDKEPVLVMKRKEFSTSV